MCTWSRVKNFTIRCLPTEGGDREPAANVVVGHQMAQRVLKGPSMGSVLVTGGAGFISSHTCKALAAHGFLPVAFDNLSKGHADFVRWGPFVQGDILNPADLDAAFQLH